MNNHQIRKTAKVVVPKTYNDKQKGNFFEQLIADLLRQQGLNVVQNIQYSGMEADCIAEESDTVHKYLVECKFRKESIDAPTLYQLLGQAWSKGFERAYLFSTSKLNSRAEGAFREEQEECRNNKNRRPILIFKGAEEIVESYIRLNMVKEPNLQAYSNNLTSLTLLIRPEHTLWVAEESKGNEPYKAIVFPTSEESEFDIRKVIDDFSRDDLWGGLKIEDGSKASRKNYPLLLSSCGIEAQYISSIGVAEDFEDYQRPCNPKHFIGRREIRRDIMNFLEDVKFRRTQTRLIGLSGRSGYGKSSLVLRLEQDILDSHNESFYFYHVDIRAASNPSFVLSAIRQAFQCAIDDGFVDLPEYKVVIESLEQSLLSSSSFQIVLDRLKRSNKVIVVFFDQFEEVFTKESFSRIYETLERTAYEVDSLKENLVLGFCWRTGNSTPDGYKSFDLWHRLEDRRKDFTVDQFKNDEQKELLSWFSSYLEAHGRKSGLDKKLKTWLLDFCPSYPWLLRKLCSDISRDVLNNTSIVAGRLVNIRALFDQDVEKYASASKKLECLEYIAKFAPVNVNKVAEKFKLDDINALLNNRLIIRTGLNFVIYWDIFRDYLLEGKVPMLHFNHQPRNSLPTALKIYKLIAKQSEGKTNINHLLSQTQVKKDTLKGVLLDLQKFGFIEVLTEDTIQLSPQVRKASNQEVAEHLERQLREHSVIRETYKNIKPGKVTTIWGFQNFVAQAYEIEKRKTIQDYASRILPWFIFAGLLEKRGSNILARPIEEGKQKGKADDCTFNNSEKYSRNNSGQLPLPFFDFEEL